jgi:hypothetical protein
VGRAFIFLIVFACLPLAAQSDHPQPPIKMTVLNVCSLSDTDAHALATALGHIPPTPSFIADFEIARGVSTQHEARSRWVRMRREFSGTIFSTAQYALSADERAVAETLVIRSREPKDMVQMSLEATVTAGRPEEVVASDTPVNRIRIERSGGASIVLARCQNTDQSASEPLFTTASQIFRGYRKALDIRHTITAELSRPDLHATKSQAGAHGGAR